MMIGIDVGGTKLEVIALDASGTILMRHRIATPANNYEAILDAIAGLVELAERETGTAGTVGVGSPGAISWKTGLVKNSNSLALNGKPLDKDLSRRLGRPIRLQNDANCFTLSEAVDGAAANAHAVFGVILGTGTGGGVVIGKQLVAGRNNIAGEWGHNPLPWPKPDELPGHLCYCGKNGCIETFLSGPGLTRDYRGRTGDERTAHDIAAAALEGDVYALQSLDAYMDRLARSLASVINILDPDAIVLGGGLSNIERLYEELPSLLRKYVFSDSIRTLILRPKFGDSSGVRGAAWLWSGETPSRDV